MHVVLMLSVGRPGPSPGLVQVVRLPLAGREGADFGVTLPRETDIRVWDSTAETRFMVVPMRPAGTEDWDEERLAQLVTRDCMVGTGLPKDPQAAA